MPVNMHFYQRLRKISTSAYWQRRAQGWAVLILLDQIAKSTDILDPCVLAATIKRKLPWIGQCIVGRRAEGPEKLAFQSNIICSLEEK